MTPTKVLPLADRFWSKVNRDGPLPTWAPFLGRCWLWTASTNNRGYGRFDLTRRTKAMDRRDRHRSAA